MTHHRTIILGVVACVVAGSGLWLRDLTRSPRNYFVRYYAGPTGQVYESSASSFSTPPGYSSEETREAHDAWLRGEDIPREFHFTEGNHLTANRTGARDPLTLEPVIEVLLEDDAEKLAVARLRLDDEVVCEATRANGLIEDHGARALARLSFTLSWIPAFTAELVWEDECGRAQSESISLGPKWLRTNPLTRWWRELGR